MKHFLTVDLAKTFWRASHIPSRASDLEEKVAFAIHVALQCIAAAWRDQKADHVVICLEGRSWRKSFYAPYKADRQVARMAKTESEQQEYLAYLSAMDDLALFLEEKTNVTVLQHPELEADDLIGGWIQAHPNDKHTIISSDTDYYQLLAENVNQYNGITGELYTIEGIFDQKGKRKIDKKTGLPLPPPDPAYILFEKCIRGDPTDNVFSAYPNVRAKSTKNKVGLQEAYADKGKQGFAWNNLMLQRWVDRNNVEHRVKDDYQRNVTLIDLSAQPAEIREKIDLTVADGTFDKNRLMIGAQFLKFCGKHGLDKLSDQSAMYGKMLSAGYSENNSSVRV